MITSESKARRSAEAASGRQTIADRVLGGVGGAMILLAVLVLLFGGPGDGAEAAGPAPEVPELRILAPAAGTALQGPLAVDFTSSVELAPQPGGWGAGGLHIHLDVNGREFMATGGNIERLPSGAYRWTLGPLTTGEHAVALFWSGADHRPLEEGRTEPVTVRVE